MKARNGLPLLLLSLIAAHAAYAATPTSAAKNAVTVFSTGGSLRGMLHSSTRPNLDSSEATRQAEVTRQIGKFVEARITNVQRSEKLTIVTEYRCGTSELTLEETMIGLGQNDEYSMTEILAFPGLRGRGTYLAADKDLYAGSLEMFGYLVGDGDPGENYDVTWTIPKVTKPELQEKIRNLCPSKQPTIVRSGTVPDTAYEIEAMAVHENGVARYRVFTEPNGELLILQQRSVTAGKDAVDAARAEKTADAPEGSLDSARNELQTSMREWRPLPTAGSVTYLPAAQVERALESARSGLIAHVKQLKSESAEAAVNSYLQNYVPNTPRQTVKIGDANVAAIAEALANKAADTILKIMDRYILAPTFTPDLLFDSTPAKARVSIVLPGNPDTLRFLDETRGWINKVAIGIYTATIENTDVPKNERVKTDFPVDLVHDDLTSWHCTLGGIGQDRKWSCKPQS